VSSAGSRDAAVEEPFGEVFSRGPCPDVISRTAAGVCLSVKSQSVSVADVRGQYENPEEGERSPLETVTKRLVKTVTETSTLCDSDL
jgi:hypothetical protein